MGASMNEPAKRDPCCQGVERESPTDAEIKSVARQDRRRAFDMLVRTYRDRLFRHALYMLKDPEEAFEATQDTLMKAYVEPALFEPAFKIKPWLFRVITNLCYNMSRDKRRRKGILRTLARPRSEPSLALDEIIRAETRASVESALGRVPEKYRSILLLKYYDDLSYVEISQVLGCKLGTVMSRLSRARDKLQACMKAE